MIVRIEIIADDGIGGRTGELEVTRILEESLSEGLTIAERRLKKEIPHRDITLLFRNLDPIKKEQQ